MCDATVHALCVVACALTPSLCHNCHLLNYNPVSYANRSSKMAQRNRGFSPNLSSHHACIYAHAYMHAHAYIYAYEHVHAHAYMHTSMHTHTTAHIHMHMSREAHDASRQPFGFGPRRGPIYTTKYSYNHREPVKKTSQSQSKTERAHLYRQSPFIPVRASPPLPPRGREGGFT